jgi:hypothetical protein
VLINNFNLKLRFRSRSRDRRPILSAGSNQLRQDLVGVDRHRPNPKQEVGGLDVRNLFNLTQKPRTSLIVEKLRRQK